jgi:hypothetical protein
MGDIVVMGASGAAGRVHRHEEGARSLVRLIVEKSIDVMLARIPLDGSAILAARTSS